jgi:hypothetical protein
MVEGRREGTVRGDSTWHAEISGNTSLRRQAIWLVIF